MTDWFRLDDRALLRIAGEDARTLLQGIITNNVALLDEREALFSALLSPQGKYLHDFVLYRSDDEAGSMVLETASERMADLLKRLKLYRLRAKVQFSALDDWYVYALTPQAVLPESLPAGAILTDDPRLSALGKRLISPEPLTLSGEGGDNEAYDHFRLTCGVPEGYKDAVIDRSLALEMGYDRLGAIDFHKGCYVGQEVTARSKHRGTLRKYLHQVCSEDGNTLPVFGTDIVSDSGMRLGDMRSAQDEIGLAMIRAESLAKAQENGERCYAGEVAVRLNVPEWMQTEHSAGL